jgi:hypothetical protein
VVLPQGKAGTLSLEQNHQSTLLWLFWRWGLPDCLGGLVWMLNTLDLTSQLFKDLGLQERATHAWPLNFLKTAIWLLCSDCRWSAVWYTTSTRQICYQPGCQVVTGAKMLVAHACNPRFSGSRDQKIRVWNQPWQIVRETLTGKKHHKQKSSWIDLSWRS